jgi:hypothetical protein
MLVQNEQCRIDGVKKSVTSIEATEFRPDSILDRKYFPGSTRGTDIKYFPLVELI